ncbi:MAG: DNA primase [candidate division WOR-3 bacterium]|jgi:DNA primase|nr:DNA primase [candidate division WOR-3 bacterium]MDH7518599.1 DNA primase [bacterium]
MIKPEVIERIRQETDIVELISGYVALKKVGRNYRGLCPFHAERSPSFYVSPERQSYHCFGCGAGGTAITFVMQYEKMEFPEAVKFLAKRLGITVEEERGGDKHQTLYDVCEKVSRFYEECLTKSATAQDYIQKRGLSNSTVKRFRLGFAPGGNILRGAARRLGLAEELLLQAGLVVKKDDGLIDYFRERIIFPIFSVSGKVIGFGGRVVGEGEPKYLNSPDTPIFHKGEILYGIFQAKSYIREEIPILVEGNFDLLTLVDNGFNNVVAGMGTALTAAQALLIRRYNRQAVLCYDGDEAGKKACWRSLNTLLASGIDPGIVLLPQGYDPDSYLRTKGREDFLGLISRRRDFVDFVIGEKMPQTVAEQREVIEELRSLLAMIPDEASRELYAVRIAKVFNINQGVLLNGKLAEKSKSEPVHPLMKSAGSILEENLVAALVQKRQFALVAVEFSFSDTVQDKTLRKIARLAEQVCDEPGFGPALLMDLIDDEEARQRIARWVFSDGTLPSEGEFRNRVRQFRARWLHQQIEEADRAGDKALVELLLQERNRLLKGVV